MRYTTAAATDCVMLGDNTNTNCAHPFAWPAANDEVATNGAVTTSRTDVQAALYNKGVGDYTVSEVFDGIDSMGPSQMTWARVLKTPVLFLKVFVVVFLPAC